MKRCLVIAAILLFTPMSFSMDIGVGEIFSIIQKQFDKNVQIVESYIFLDEHQQAIVKKKTNSSVPFYLPYFIIRSGEDLIGYAVRYESMGRYHPFTFLLVLDSQLSIQSVLVLEYNSSHGYEIKENDFRKQFIGKSSRDPLKIGKDIDGISGATISSYSITGSIRLLVNYLEIGLKE